MTEKVWPRLVRARGRIAVGLAAALALALAVHNLDISALGGALAGAGWAAAALVAVRAAVLTLCGLAWAPLLARPHEIVLAAFVRLRWVREAVNVLLPVAAVGGDILGARLLARRGAPPAAAGASVLGDVLLQATAQLAFTAAGVAALAASGLAPGVTPWLAGGLGVALAALSGFFLAQRFGGGRWLDRAVRWAAGRGWLPAGAATFDLHGRLKAMYARPSVIGASFTLHLLAWFVGAAEIWIALRALGFELGWPEALVIESLAQAARGAAFPVPSGVGVQEAGLVFLCSLYGVPAEAAVAVSLLKRAPDLVLGAVGLWLWSRLERAPARSSSPPTPALASSEP